jgi:homoserine O-acetyltransferase/O-succinyltransferase
MFGPDQAARRGQVLPHLPEAIGLGGSSEPSDGLHDRFPRYGYKVMGAAEERLSPRVLGSNICG